jgi:5-formyltetrahydrofolate cyclo-ligase
MRRRALPMFRRRLGCRAIARHLRALPAFRRAQHVAIYWPTDGEADVRGVAEYARSRGKTLYLPKVGRSGTMRFAPWPPTAQLRKNRYGIPEPVNMRWRSVPAARLQVIVMPLVAFDGRGHRLGMGGGYYDRALAGRRRRPLLIGTAFSFQQAPMIPAQPWDVPLDMVITECGRATRHATRRASPRRPEGATQ